jgi:DNA-binding LytR/AlgR family response regulator
METYLAEYAAASGTDLSVECFSSPEPFLEGYSPYRYSTIFLDIYMDGMSGLDAAAAIRQVDRSVVIIFLTSSDEHRPEAFRFHAFDYVTKPVERSRVFSVLDDLFSSHEITDIPRFSFISRKVQYSLPISDLVCVQSAAHYLDISDISGNVYSTRMTFSEAAAALSAYGCFLQLMRGVLVNMDHISGFGDYTCSLSTGQSFPINMRRSRELEDTWKNYKFTRIRESAMRRNT